ncbi:hypothetical protein PPYR_13982 [Photinus pyralis]|uniref:Uncharacterized protein n=2 Tax=Photinus pyralis TaxID=7054 RepID=A0A5N4A3Y9_PHOPY|nr:uncharacterized protein LOC116180387 [Photinus pyralis]KAB0792021.1 hypothetical protein PPYR_13982 [Photinus pyralis]
MATMPASKRVKLSTTKSVQKKTSDNLPTLKDMLQSNLSKTAAQQEDIINLVTEDEGGQTERTTTTHLRNNSTYSTLDELLDHLDGNIHHVYAPQRVIPTPKLSDASLEHGLKTSSVNNMLHYQHHASAAAAPPAPILPSTSTSYQLHIPEATAQILQHIIIPPPPPPPIEEEKQQTSTTTTGLHPQHAQKDMKVLRELYETISQPPSTSGVPQPSDVAPSWFEPSTPRELGRASLAWLEQKAPIFRQRYLEAQEKTRRLEEEVAAARLNERRLEEEVAYIEKFVNFLK